MRFLVISDLHGDLISAWEAVRLFEPEVLLSCGDWGDPEQVDEIALARFPSRLPVYTTFGNHDPIALLRELRNGDGTPVLLPQGRVVSVAGIRLAAIGGIWARSHRQPYYVTDDDVAAAAARIAAEGGADILLTHGCPVGLVDRTPRGIHGGQRCFLQAFQTVAPRVHLCGHLHVAQEHLLSDGRKVINVGATPRGSAVVVETEGAEVRAALVRSRPSAPDIPFADSGESEEPSR
jgi:Icc-related predicted phosphoesterase